jgi:hypothetical protein
MPLAKSVELAQERLTLCVSVDHQLVCRPSPFGECDALRISSLENELSTHSFFSLSVYSASASRRKSNATFTSEEIN